MNQNNANLFSVFGKIAAQCALLVFITIIMVSCAPTKPSQSDVDLYLKARDRYLQGNLDEAQKFVESIESRKNSFHQARLLEVKILFFQGRLDQSQSLASGLVERYPASLEARLWLIRILQSQSKTSEAASLIQDALELNPADPRLLQAAGLNRMASNDINGALGFFKRAEEFSDEFAHTWLESARIIYRFGFAQQALTDLDHARALQSPGSTLRKALEDLSDRIKQGTKQ